MELYTFAIYDSKADSHPSDFKAASVALGCRVFQEAVIDENTHFAKHPGDYSLIQTGTWDQDTAIAKDLAVHIDHGTARMWRAKYFLEQDAHSENPQVIRKPMATSTTDVIKAAIAAIDPDEINGDELKRSLEIAGEHLHLNRKELSS